MCMSIYIYTNTHTSSSSSSFQFIRIIEDEIDQGSMAEELISCWNSPRNLFSSSPCSLGWPSYEMIMDMRSSCVGSTDESASDGSRVARPPISSDLQIMGISSATAGDWNHDLLRDTGKSEENNNNYSNFLLDSSMLINSRDSAEPLNSISTSSECVATSYSYASSLLQSLFDTDTDTDTDTDSQPQQSLVDMNAYSVNSNGFLPSASAPMLTLTQQQPTANRNIWSTSTTDAPSTFLPSPQSQFISSSLTLTNHSIHTHTTAAIAKQPREQGKASNEPAFKRPRMETPSPLPTFKVRKEKLGDRITALQQLVSPFGKTDTASVLHEAIDYIKFLHDQVNALSTPYLKYGSPPRRQQQDEQGLTKELKTRGLCLVPISSTFPVAAETTADFWTPTFGGSFR